MSNAIEWSIIYSRPPTEPGWLKLDRPRAFFVGRSGGRMVACIFQEWGIVDTPEGLTESWSGYALRYYRDGDGKKIRFDVFEDALDKAEEIAVAAGEKPAPVKMASGVN